MREYTAFNRSLDLGGWFKPHQTATHVTDLMPYETRWGRLNLAPLPGERFSKDTWTQVDFLNENLRLPYEDKFFDFAFCGQTIEDLVNPEPLLREMMRVARKGQIVCPSRLHEQTVGVRDRESKQCGHPHHHWIAEIEHARLILWSKKDSVLERTRATIPLLEYERIVKRDNIDVNVYYDWSDEIEFSLRTGIDCAARAEAFARGLNISRADRFKDSALRALRRLRSRLRSSSSGEDWWPKILEQSRKYSNMPLPEV